MVRRNSHSPSVGILLSTYNGQTYLHELMQSLLGQSYPHIRIFIRDDGSTDRTPVILKEFQGQKNVHIVYGGNIGAVESYFQLLQAVAPQVDYIAFCDQDDVWRRHKIAWAVAKLDQAYAHADQPWLYFSDYCLVDETLNVLGPSYLANVRPDFRNAVVQNIVTGCTAVINRVAAEGIVRNLPQADRVVMHDWWVYLYVSAFGEIVFDSQPTVFYRQHRLNLVGVHPNRFFFWLARIKRNLQERSLTQLARQAREFDCRYGHELPPDKKRVLDDFLQTRSTIRGRMTYARHGDTFRQVWIDDQIYRLLLIFQKRA